MDCARLYSPQMTTTIIMHYGFQNLGTQSTHQEVEPLPPPLDLQWALNGLWFYQVE